MKNALLASGLILAGLVGVADRATAHHSFAAEFDSKKPIKLKGVVTKVDWTNPHVWIHLNVKDDSGTVKNWGAEMGPPHGLQGGGWRRETLKIGDEITVDGFLAKNGTVPPFHFIVQPADHFLVYAPGSSTSTW